MVPRIVEFRFPGGQYRRLSAVPARGDRFDTDWVVTAVHHRLGRATAYLAPVLRTESESRQSFERLKTAISSNGRAARATAGYPIDASELARRLLRDTRRVRGYNREDYKFVQGVVRPKLDELRCPRKGGSRGKFIVDEAMARRVAEALDMTLAD